MAKQTVFGHIAALLCVLVWGTTFISTKLLLGTFTPLEILLLRMVIAVIGLIPLYPKRLPFLGWRREGILALAGLFGVTLYSMMENTSLTLSMASVVAVLVAVSPFFTALLSVRSGEKPSGWFFFGFICAICGVALISFNGQTLRLNPIGDILAIGAALVWACYSILTRNIGSWGYSVIQTTRRIFCYGLLFLLPFCVPLGFSIKASDFSPLNLGNLLFLGLTASAVCFVLWSMAVRRLGAVKTSVYIYLIPVVTAIAAFLILQETITPLALSGAALILVGLLFSGKRRKSYDKD